MAMKYSCDPYIAYRLTGVPYRGSQSHSNCGVKPRRPGGIGPGQGGAGGGGKGDPGGGGVSRDFCQVGKCCNLFRKKGRPYQCCASVPALCDEIGPGEIVDFEINLNPFAKDPGYCAACIAKA